MSAAPYFDSGGFNRDQQNNIGVFLVDLDGSPYVASGGAGGGGGLVQMQLREGGSWVNAPGSAARGLLVDGASGTTDGAVGLPARADVVAGYDGANARVLKTSAAGVLQVDVLTLPAGGATAANQATEIARLEAIRDRLPDTTATAAPSATDEGMVVHVATMPAGGGGSVAQYTEADIDASITGIAMLWEDASDTLRAVSAAKPLPVSGPLTDTQLRATPVPVSGTVTANGPLTDAQLRATAVPVDTELTTADLDTGAGTDTRAVVGLVRAESGGALLVGSANPLPVVVSSALPAGTNNIGDVDVLTLPANASVNLNQVAGTGLAVNTGNASAGTQRVVLATDQPSVMVRGEIAHDGADSGNPQKVGGRARTADITAVAQDDRTDSVYTILGKQVVQNYALPANFVDGKTSAALTNTTAADVIAAPGAGIRLYITEITVTNSHATVGTKVEIRDGTTVKRIVDAAALGGGASMTFPTPLRLTANTALTARNVTTGADVEVSASGYKAAE